MQHVFLPAPRSSSHAHVFLPAPCLLVMQTFLHAAPLLLHAHVFLTPPRFLRTYLAATRFFFVCEGFSPHMRTSCTLLSSMHSCFSLVLRTRTSSCSMFFSVVHIFSCQRASFSLFHFFLIHAHLFLPPRFYFACHCVSPCSTFLPRFYCGFFTMICTFCSALFLVDHFAFTIRM